MLFNSIEFALFLPIVFIIYWFVVKKSLLVQNAFILIASYIFYGWWDWRFLSLIFLSTIVDFAIGKKIYSSKNANSKKYLLWASIAVNIGILGFFKYFNFFQENLISALDQVNIHVHASSLNIILPVGISFYTFQTLSYTIDVYRKKLSPTKDFIAFGAFVSFFPQLVAGPIERASHLLPQFSKRRVFNYNLAMDGMRQILWGLFKKVVIADNCAEIANQIFNNSSDIYGSNLVIGALFFSFQIYGDFSGYSDIAIGTSRLFGFDLMRNFAFPYFSRNIAEFWRRWHISLSTWFRDYLYIPLGGSQGSKLNQVRNTFVIFIVSGFWHGANWTFIIWGFVHALLFIPLLLTGKNRKFNNNLEEVHFIPNLRIVLQILTTFTLTTFAWIFFRAESLQHAFSFIGNIFSKDLLSIPSILSIKLIVISLFISFMFFVEWMGRNKQHGLEIVTKYPALVRYGSYFFLVISILWFRGSTQDFIYFQF